MPTIPQSSLPSCATRAFALIVLSWLVAADVARADPQNGQLIPLGERQAYLANTGVSDASDTGAVYFNPAGLGFIDRDKVSVTGSVYMSYATRSDAAFRLDDSDVGYEAKGFMTIPMTFVIAKKLGDVRVAFSTLVPESISTENQQSFETPNTTGKILQYYRESELWVGLTAAYPLAPRLSLGVSVFGIQHSQSSLVSLLIDFPSDPTTFVTASSRSQWSTFGLSAVLGVAYRPTDDVGVGLRVQTPIAQLTGSADTYQAERSPAEPPMTEDIKGTHAKYQLPLDLTLGGSFKLLPSLEVLVDLSLRLGVTYDSIPASALNDHIETRPTPRASIGAEWKPVPVLPVRAGFFYSPSAERDQPGALRENYCGVTAGVAYITEHVETGVGAFYIWANGTQRSDEGVATHVSTTAIGALLTTAYVF
jgi:long-subunit fatty acid transport protein